MNSNIDLSGGDYQTTMARLLRQQQFADQSQREAMEPLQAPQGAVAPISVTNVLAKALQAWGARRQSDKIDERYQQLGQQDRSAADALVAQLTKQTPAVQGPQTTVSGTLPSLPGQTAPQPQGPQVPIQTPTAPPQPALSPEQQMAAILGARGGPQTQMIQGALLPQIMQRQNKEWDASQPMTRAAREGVQAQIDATNQEATYRNKLGPTAAENIGFGLKRQELANEQRKTDMMYGSGTGVDSPEVAHWSENIRTGIATMQNVPNRFKTAVSDYLATLPGGAFSPLATRRFVMSAGAIAKPYMDMPQYQLTAGAAPYLQRMDAALKMPRPTAVSDQELLDSFTKLNTGGNAVTDAQVNIITGNKSLGDWLNVAANKLKGGGPLSDAQRKQIGELAHEVYKNYQKGWEPLAKEVDAKMEGAQIPKAFRIIPDLSKLDALQNPASAGTSKGLDAQGQAALNWANANPKDPRAAQIKQRLGVP